MTPEEKKNLKRLQIGLVKLGQKHKKTVTLLLSKLKNEKSKVSTLKKEHLQVIEKLQNDVRYEQEKCARIQQEQNAPSPVVNTANITKEEFENAAKLQAQVEAMKVQLQEEVQKSVRLTAKISSFSGNHVEDSFKQINELKEEVSKLKKELRKDKKELKEFQEESKESEEQLNKIIEDKQNKIQENIEVADKKDENFNLEKEKIQTENTVKQENIDDLTNTLKDRDEEIVGHKNTISERDLSTEKLQTEIQSLQERIKDLEEIVNKYDIVVLKEMVDFMQYQLTEMAESNTQENLLDTLHEVFSLKYRCQRYELNVLGYFSNILIACNKLENDVKSMIIYDEDSDYQLPQEMKLAVNE